MNGKTCDPSVNPECEKPLTDTDRTTLASLIADKIKDPSSLPEPARQQCGALLAKVNDMLPQNIKRGLFDTHDGDQGVDPQFGAYNSDTKNMHIDPQFLDGAATGDDYTRREVANTLLHEAAHALGLEHPSGYLMMPDPSHPQNAIYLYSDSPYDLLSPGSNSCIKW